LSKNGHKRITKNQKGFTLIEAIVAIFVITIGLIGTAAALSYAIHYGTISRNVTSSKLMIVATFEEIETLRNSRRLQFSQIANTGNVNNTGAPATFTGFRTGFQPVSLNPGPDGVNGTADDLMEPGLDGTYGTADDVENPALIRGGYQREIIIANLSTSMKRVEVKVRFLGSGGRVGEISGVSYINDESRLTR
jgi:prepilin-type N-terminal cleavage/methylation domain-containing protein